MPVSLIGAFAFITYLDFSINTLTLFAIVLATGIVVDDAIVVIENIERHMAEGKKRAYRAALDAMREVFGAVVVIGIVLVAVFVPVAFFPGTVGRLYQQFSLTIASRRHFRLQRLDADTGALGAAAPARRGGKGMVLPLGRADHSGRHELLCAGRPGPDAMALGHSAGIRRVVGSDLLRVQPGAPGLPARGRGTVASCRRRRARHWTTRPAS
jgi:hypothetical protein